MLPLGLGYAEGITRDYKRHGTTTLFAALDALSGTVLADCKPRHRHQEFLAFLRNIEISVPAQLDVHLIVDNYSAHKHPRVKAWSARRPHWHIHFIPTYSSWLNQVERFFARLGKARKTYLTNQRDRTPVKSESTAPQRRCGKFRCRSGHYCVVGRG
jgi:putative transposase